MDAYSALEASRMVEKSVHSWAPDVSDSRGIGVDRDFDVMSLPDEGDRFDRSDRYDRIDGGDRRLVASDDGEEVSSGIGCKHAARVRAAVFVAGVFVCRAG